MFNFSSRLYNFAPVLQRSFSYLCKNECTRIHFLRTNFTIDVKFCASIHFKQPKQFDWDQYALLNDRLESIPYLDLLNGELERVHSSFIQEDEKALADVSNWCSKVFDYNVKKGKKIRAIALLKAYCAYEFNMQDESWKLWHSEGWKSAIILAWCVEILQAFFLVSDDIMDQSSLRRGEPCWYKKPDVGLCAVNDSLLLQCGVYKLLKKHFGHLQSYNSILQEFLQVTHKTAYGQCLDILSNPVNQRPRFSDFTYEKYQTIVEYKTSNYTYCLPVYLAMHLVGRCSADEFKMNRDLCLKLGLYFQSQDDYLDCFGDPKKTGKFGNDIREGKCTWFTVKFLEQASPSMVEEFSENYGIDNDKSISTIMRLYRNSSVLEQFKLFEEDLCLQIRNTIESMGNVNGGLFYNFFSQIKQREK